jgi:hypothetical protein
VIDTEDHQGIDAMLAKRQPSRTGALLTVFLALVACVGFGMFWGWLMIVTGAMALP